MFNQCIDRDLHFISIYGNAMQISLLKKLTLVVMIASTYAITGCSDANSKNTAPLKNSAKPAVTATITVNNAQTGEEAKRNAEAGNELY